MSVAVDEHAPLAWVDGDLIFAVRDVTLRFGGVTSLADVTISQKRGEVLCVIGPNGAGKTSLFNCLTAVYHPQEGSIVFRPLRVSSHQVLGAKGPPVAGGPARSAAQGSGPDEVTEHPIIGTKPHKVNQYGMARTFQTSRLYNALTTFENVKIGVEARQHTGPLGAMLRLPRTRREEAEGDRRSMQLLDFVGLRKRANDLAGSLPYGDRRRLEIARALGTEPQLLLLDEPAAGTNPSEKLELVKLVRRANQEMGVSVLLIEHDMGMVMSIADRIVVLNFGRVIAAGTPSQVQRDPAVIEAYLGSAPATERGPGPGRPTLAEG